MCDTQSVWFAPAYVGYRIFFTRKRFSTNGGQKIVKLELSYVVEWTLMKLEDQNCASY